MRPGPIRWWPVALAWAVSRAVTLWWLATDQSLVFGDVRYYADSLAGLADAGFGDTLVEYPLPAVLALWVPYALLELLGATDLYLGAIAALATATDLAFFVCLVRTRRLPAAWAWVLAVPALGATAYARFDLIPGILVGLAVLALRFRPAVAGALGALATGVKYWPAIVLPALAAPASTRRRTILTIAGTGAVLALVTVVLGGWDRLFTPLTYQDERGLQMESVAATPAMLGWGFGADGYATHYAPYKAYEVTGPMVSGWMTLTSVATVVLVVTLVVLWVLAWRRLRGLDESGPESAEALVWLVLVSAGGFIVTSKVLSPQYLLWLLPVAAAGLAILRTPSGGRRLAGWTAVLLVATALTQLVFPRWYGALIEHSDASAAVVCVLAARNLLLLGLVVYAGWRTFRSLGALTGITHDGQKPVPGDTARA